ncbi:PREDICTED: ATPase WRNIP1-like isoform X1 [Papilio xuthus]|uniref:ATPase WRNIP1-like isoform X1 n=1 Tax=Papilio xuthus TaxID=66420 RepID=A0AAJ7E9K0_PAPXU|nr:PREDICTED: ATPase WRNIP1-like isoform X1 [Papilio xuthus]
MSNHNNNPKSDKEPCMISCPVCNREFRNEAIENHVNKCLFLLNSQMEKTCKRDNSHLKENPLTPKRLKIETTLNSKDVTNEPHGSTSKNSCKTKSQEGIPLAEQLRPQQLDDIVGQIEAFGPGSMLRSVLEQKKIPNMILWGPPGCGKTSIANVVAHICKESSTLRFVKLSATMAGVNDVKEVVKIAKNEAQYKRQTVLFVDEIHRFNKLQQDSFLAHVENGTLILIGATTENPSFSLNNALLSRCRVVVLSKLTIDNILQILIRSVVRNKLAVLVDAEDMKEDLNESKDIPVIENKSLQWLAEVCDGDARIALGALELAITAARAQMKNSKNVSQVITLGDLQNGIKRSHVLYDRQGEEHYNIISAIHKSIRASDDNAALYWTTRALHSGEDPLYIARRLIRIACEDIGLRDQNAVVEAVACLQGCQHIGMPECDVLLVQCAVSLARAPKSREVYEAMKRCQAFLSDTKGSLPAVPLHLRNAPTKLMKSLGYGKGYNLLHKNESGLNYMPEAMESVNFFQES